VSRVNFNSSWYHDANKANGGWSVEQIDPLNPCAGASNWTASMDASGGTPGRINSVNGENNIQPKVERISLFANYIVQLWFDQQMDAASLLSPQNYLVEELGEHHDQVETNPIDPNYVGLIFDHGFEQGIVYTLIINGVTNCVGNAIEADTRVQFGIPNAIAEGEILINEILFDPISPGVDYVELYNNTDKTFDLSTLMLGVIREGFPNPADTTLKEITADSRLFLPQTYVLLSTNSEIVGYQYDCPTDNYVQMASFPSYANAGGTAILLSKSGTTVDAMYFSEKMHYPLLKVTKGVALERVSFDQPSMATDNWHSAAERVHFGTPGQPNSMMQSTEPSDDEISVSPDVFSPDGDGFDDACFINYHFDEAGYTMNIYIFNVAGQLIRHLAKGELVGQEGSVLWNGLDGNGNKIPVGVYVVVTEVFNFSGKVKQFKNAIIVGTR
ncbi:MAG: lamin tail domain-containing protein, partial [Bacteroidales bacterium]|nr:lamin tail domain-containing protein [Bacteroidales bacterium]